jgi:hypothetical protein
LCCGERQSDVHANQQGKDEIAIQAYAAPATSNARTKACLGDYTQNDAAAIKSKLGLSVGRWKRLAAALEQSYDLRPWGGRQWLLTKPEFGAYAVATVWGRLQQSADEVLSMRELAQLQATQRAEGEQVEGVEGSVAPARRRKGKHGKHASGGGGGGGKTTPEVGA